jgi:DNA-binding winged helix-turn-helix (wHTH) protein
MSKALAPVLGWVPDALDAKRTSRDQFRPPSARPPLMRGGNTPPDAASVRPVAGPLGGTAGIHRADAKEGSRAEASRFDAFRLDTVNEYLWRGDVPVELAPKAFAVLRYLVEHPGRLVTHRELLETLWPETYVQPEILKTYIRDIRKILADDPRAPRFIRTRARRGYHFIAAVSHESPPVLTVPGESAAPGPVDGKTTPAWAGPRLSGPDPARSPWLAQFPHARLARPERRAATVANGPIRLHQVRPLPKGQPPGDR